MFSINVLIIASRMPTLTIVNAIRQGLTSEILARKTPIKKSINSDISRDIITIISESIGIKNPNMNGDMPISPAVNGLMLSTSEFRIVAILFARS